MLHRANWRQNAAQTFENIGAIMNRRNLSQWVIGGCLTPESPVTHREATPLSLSQREQEITQLAHTLICM